MRSAFKPKEEVKIEPLFKIDEKVKVLCRDGITREAVIIKVEVRQPFAGRDISGPNKDKTLIYYRVKYLSEDKYDTLQILNIYLENELQKV